MIPHSPMPAAIASSGAVSSGAVSSGAAASPIRTGGGGSGRQRAVGGLVGTCLLAGFWAYVAGGQPELVLPSPAETGRAIVELVTDGSLLAALPLTLGRAAFAVVVALVIGLCWGIVNGVSQWASAISQAWLSTLMALPPVVLVVVGLTWLGPGAATTRLVVVLVAVPLIVVAVEQAVLNIDGDLLEMAAAFKLSKRDVLRHVIAPAISSPTLAATSVAFGQSLRVAVMAELLSASDGVGAGVARARANLETADVFAWAIVLVVIVLVLELMILRPLAEYLLRWRSPS